MMPDSVEAMVERLGAHIDSLEDHGAGNTPRMSLDDLIAIHEVLAIIVSLAGAIVELRAALKPFADCPMVGKDGGRFIIAHAVYEDMLDGVSAPRAAYWHEDQFEKARAILAAIGESVGE